MPIFSWVEPWQTYIEECVIWHSATSCRIKFKFLSLVALVITKFAYICSQGLPGCPACRIIQQVRVGLRWGGSANEHVCIWEGKSEYIKLCFVHTRTSPFNKYANSPRMDSFSNQHTPDNPHNNKEYNGWSLVLIYQGFISGGWERSVQLSDFNKTKFLLAPVPWQAFPAGIRGTGSILAFFGQDVDGQALAADDQACLKAISCRQPCSLGDSKHGEWKELCLVEIR